MDHRIGCMLGKSSPTGDFYALARNQIAVLKLDISSSKWKYVPDKAIPNVNSFSFKNAESANTIGAVDSPANGLEESHGTIKWQGNRRIIFS